MSRTKSTLDSRLKQAALARVRAIYRELEGRPVTRACERRTDCCRFQLTGKTPYLTRGEALVAAAGWRATGRRGLPDRGGACPFLSDPGGRCLIYADRPFGCRTHFCGEAGGPYPRGEVVDLIWELEKLDAELGGTGGVVLESAIRAVLASD